MSSASYSPRFGAPSAVDGEPWRRLRRVSLVVPLRPGHAPLVLWAQFLTGHFFKKKYPNYAGLQPNLVYPKLVKRYKDPVYLFLVRVL